MVCFSLFHSLSVCSVFFMQVNFIYIFLHIKNINYVFGTCHRSRGGFVPADKGGTFSIKWPWRYELFNSSHLWESSSDWSQWLTRVSWTLIKLHKKGNIPPQKRNLSYSQNHKFFIEDRERREVFFHLVVCNICQRDLSELWTSFISIWLKFTPGYPQVNVQPSLKSIMKRGIFKVNHEKGFEDKAAGRCRRSPEKEIQSDFSSEAFWIQKEACWGWRYFIFIHFYFNLLYYIYFTIASTSVLFPCKKNIGVKLITNTESMHQVF